MECIRRWGEISYEHESLEEVLNKIQDVGNSEQDEKGKEQIVRERGKILEETVERTIRVVEVCGILKIGKFEMVVV